MRPPCTKAARRQGSVEHGRGFRLAARRALIALPLVALATVLLQVANAFVTGAPRLGVTAGSFRAAGQRRHLAAAREVGERAAHIAVVDVHVKAGMKKAFIDASLENARGSVREQTNRRFDVLQNQDDSSRFVLVEIYPTAQGPLDHKETEHYLTWRETVADMMASPRQASQFDTVFPSKSSSFGHGTLFLERDGADPLEILHTRLDVRPNEVEKFLTYATGLAKYSILEEGCLRFDVLRNVERTNEFMLIEAYRNPDAVREHLYARHYQIWSKALPTMLSKERTEKRYVNHFPTVPAAWAVDRSAI
mmetsp:Transcript_46966/g.102158  ORF Transcript_46966/g.102158 Transcript_46966/m.102158 type:complete len:307 (+) Transcript_46966:62-982(+)